VKSPALARVTHCLGTGDGLGSELERVLADRSEVLLVAPRIRPEGDHEDWPTQAAVAVITRLRAVLDEDVGHAGRHCLVVVVVPSSEEPEVTAAAEASVEAMRGIVQSISREVDPAVLRVNLVIGAERNQEDVLRCVDFVSSASGGFFVGSTVDLR
jgi:hypothetical protein